MIEVKNMDESELLYRWEQTKDRIREIKKAISKYHACIARNEEEVLRLMREEVVLKEAVRELDKGGNDDT